jgi:hypothetical protein
MGHLEALDYPRFDVNRVGQGSGIPQQLRPLKEFHDHPRYAEDLHRADLA